jgi:hypothetical protein
LIFALITVLIVGNFSRIYESAATSENDFSNTSNLITAAYIDLHSAEQKGGNVSTLVVQLNAALSLYHKAQQENLTDPNQASIDLSDATQLANNVSSESTQIGQAGAAARIAQQTNAEVEITLVILGAAFLYIFGPTIYRRVWLFVYKDFVVRAQNG